MPRQVTSDIKGAIHSSNKRKQPNLPQKQDGESWEAFSQRVDRWRKGEDVRSKTDLRNWTGSLPFHLNREK
jgi:hypothetical protein